VRLTKVHRNLKEAIKEVIMTAKTDARENQCSHQRKETVKAKAGANWPGKELKETVQAKAGANWPSKILKEAVKLTTIPDPQEHPGIAEILMTLVHQDTIGPGQNHLGPNLRRKTLKKALIITCAVCGFMN
jgi:hypothetical protein